MILHLSGIDVNAEGQLVAGPERVGPQRHTGPNW